MAEQGYEVGAGYISLYANTEGVAEGIDEAFGTATESAQQAGEQAGEALERGSRNRVRGLGERLMAWGGFAAIGAAVGSLFKSGWDTANIDLAGSMAANLGGQASTWEAYAEEASDLYALGWGENLEEVGADITAIMSEATDLYAEELQTLYPKVAGIAEQTGEDISRIMNASSRMMGAGLASSWDEAADIIAAGFQKLGNTAGTELLDTLVEYSVQFQKVGIDAEMAIGLIDQMMLAGARSPDLAADAIKEFAIRAIDGSGSTVEAYEAIGVSAEDMQRKIAAGGPAATEAFSEVISGLRDMGDTAQREATAVKLFGTQAEDLGEALFAIDPTAASTALGDVSGSAQEMADASMSLDEMLQGLGRTLELSIADALRPLLPMLRDGMTALQGFFGWLRDNPVITTILLGIASALALVAAGQVALNIAMLASPVTWIIMGIIVAVGLLVGALVWLIQHWDGVVAKFENGARQIQMFFLPMLENTQFGIDTFVAAAQNGASQLQSFWLSALENTKFGLDTFVGAAKNGADQIGSWFGSVFDGISTWGSEAWANVTTGIQNTIQYLVDLAVWAMNEFNKLTGGPGGVKAPKIPGAGNVPGLAEGGTVTRSGLTWVGEEGPELLSLGRGSSVIPLPDVADMVSSGGGDDGRGGDTFVFNSPVGLSPEESLKRRRNEIASLASL